MPTIGLISDTHSYLDDAVYRHFADCDEIWHAGDFGVGVADKLKEFKPLRGVYGNIDNSDIVNQFPEHEKFMIEGLSVWITHIGGYPGKYNPKIRSQIQNEKPDLYITGHSHILKVMRDPKIPNLLHLNPGAAGKEGFHKIKTLMKFEINQAKITELKVIELGKR